MEAPPPPHTHVSTLSRKCACYPTMCLYTPTQYPPPRMRSLCATTGRSHQPPCRAYLPLAPSMATRPWRTTVISTRTCAHARTCVSTHAHTHACTYDPNTCFYTPTQSLLRPPPPLRSLRATMGCSHQPPCRACLPPVCSLATRPWPATTSPCAPAPWRTTIAEQSIA